MSAAPAGLELAFETSRRESYLALAAGATLLEDRFGECAHASELLPRLLRLLAHAGIEQRGGKLPLAHLYVGSGPGSYTGLRVGMATALGLARASGAALYGIPSFETLAWAELEIGQEGAVVLDARAGRFYHARYRREARDVVALSAPEACTASDLAARCAHPGPVLGHAGLAEAAGLGSLAGLRTDAVPRARALLELARLRRAAGKLVPSATLEPLYLREFGAGGARSEREAAQPPR